MSNVTNYLEERLLKHSVGLASYTMPTTYLALFTANPGETGSLAAEVSGGSYERKSWTPSWNAGSSRIENSALVRWDGMPAATVTHVGIMDGDTEGAGNMLWYGALASSVAVSAGNSFEIPAASLTVVMD